MVVKHIRNKERSTIPLMAKTPPSTPSKAQLWENLTSLMTHHWHEININRLAREAKIGPASVQRIKDQETSVGLDIVDKVAQVWGLQAWQLLLPDLDPENVPFDMISESQKALFDRLKRARALLTDEHPAEPQKPVTAR
jgi:hypothetical protein